MLKRIIMNYSIFAHIQLKLYVDYNLNNFFLGIINLARWNFDLGGSILEYFRDVLFRARIDHDEIRKILWGIDICGVCYLGYRPCKITTASISRFTIKFLSTNFYILINKHMYVLIVTYKVSRDKLSN